MPHERVTIDLASGAQKKPEYLALNPNGKVPLLVVDGTPIFEAVAIMQWLGDRYGVARGLWPAADSPVRLTALAWTTWAYVTFGGSLVKLVHASSKRVPAEFHNAALAQATHAELQRLLSMVNARLTERPYMLGATFSLADLILFCTINYAGACDVPVETHPAIGAWRTRCAPRPSLQNPWG